MIKRETEERANDEHLVVNLRGSGEGDLGGIFEAGRMRVKGTRLVEVFDGGDVVEMDDGRRHDGAERCRGRNKEGRS